MSKTYNILGRSIFADENYFVLYSDNNTNDPNDPKYREYSRIKSMPDGILKDKMIIKLPIENNPSVFIMTGEAIREMVYEKKYVPLFDPAFSVNRKLTLMPPDANSFYLKHSKMIRR